MQVVYILGKSTNHLQCYLCIAEFLARMVGNHLEVQSYHLLRVKVQRSVNRN